MFFIASHKLFRQKSNLIRFIDTKHSTRISNKLLEQDFINKWTLQLSLPIEIIHSFKMFLNQKAVYLTSFKLYCWQS
jgi:hypothetical protein